MAKTYEDLVYGDELPGTRNPGDVLGSFVDAPPATSGTSPTTVPTLPSFTGNNAAYAAQLQNAYKIYLGREASQQEIQSRLNDPNFRLQTQLSSIQTSPEAYAYSAGGRKSTDTSTTDTTTDTSGWKTDSYEAPKYTATVTGAALPGWEQTKWDDTTHQTPKYAVGRILASGDMKDPAVRAKAIEDIQKAYPGSKFDGKDSLTVPGVGTFDIFIGASEGKYIPAWRPTADASGKPIPTGAGGGGGTVTGTTTTSTTGGYAPPPGVSEDLWNQLMTRSKQGIDVSRNDPAVRGRADAFSAQEERARRNYLGDLAEKSSPYTTGAQAGAERMSAEKMGQDVGAFEADLMGKEITARRDEIQHALTTMSTLLTDQQRNQLQLQIAQMNDALGRLGLTQQQQQFLDEMGFKNTQESNYWDWIQRPGNEQPVTR